MCSAYCCTYQLIDSFSFSPPLHRPLRRPLHQFNAHDALAGVDAEHDLVKVAYAKKWTGARRAELEGDEVKVSVLSVLFFYIAACTFFFFLVEKTAKKKAQYIVHALARIP